MTVEAQLQAQMEDTAALTDLVGTRIFRYQRPRGTALPAVTFKRTNTDPVNHAGGVTATEWVSYEVNIWANDMDVMRSVADAVATALSGFSNPGGDPSISMSHLQSEIDATENPEHGDDNLLFHFIQDYRLSHGA